MQTGLIILAIYLAVAICISGGARFLTWKPLVYLGTISYSLYLIHAPIGERLELLLYWLNAPTYLYLPVSVLAAIGAAVLVTEFVDRPGHRAINRAYRAFKDRRKTRLLESNA